MLWSLRASNLVEKDKGVKANSHIAGIKSGHVHQNTHREPMRMYLRLSVMPKL
jgi:hypothetical protein